MNNFVYEEIYYEAIKNYNDNDIDNYINNYLDLFDIRRYKHTRVNELSLGTKQKVALCSIFSLNSKIIILDEPFSNLDKKSCNKLLDILKDIKKKKEKIIIIIEHQINNLTNLIDKFVVLKDKTIQIKDSLYLISYFYQNNPKKIEKNQNKNILDVKDLYFSYYNKNILTNISFNINQGEIVGLLGDNGSGKSTLAQLITGLKKPKKGMIFFNGKKLDIRTMAHKIGFIMQNPLHQLFCDTVYEEVTFAPLNFNLFNEIKIQDFLKDIKLLDLKDRYIHTLSFGQQQRTAIVSAISFDPDLIVMDEPVLGQDFNTLNMIINFMINQRNKGKSFIIISHIHELVYEIADRVLELESGKIYTRK